MSTHGECILWKGTNNLICLPCLHSVFAITSMWYGGSRKKITKYSYMYTRSFYMPHGCSHQCVFTKTIGEYYKEDQ